VAMLDAKLARLKLSRYRSRMLELKAKENCIIGPISFRT
jgi:hypothetical protein